MCFFNAKPCRKHFLWNIGTFIILQSSDLHWDAHKVWSRLEKRFLADCGSAQKHNIVSKNALIASQKAPNPSKRAPIAGNKNLPKNNQVHDASWQSDACLNVSGAIRSWAWSLCTPFLGYGEILFPWRSVRVRVLVNHSELIELVPTNLLDCGGLSVLQKIQWILCFVLTSAIGKAVETLPQTWFTSATLLGRNTPCQREQPASRVPYWGSPQDPLGTCHHLIQAWAHQNRANLCGCGGCSEPNKTWKI